METKSMNMQSATGPDDSNFDRISSLPDPLICYILSFLSTKESVATSVLSRRWSYLFALVPDFELEFVSTYCPEGEKSLIESLDSWRLIMFLRLGCRILQLREMTPIRKLKLSLFWTDEKCRLLIEWFISTALLFNVQELQLFIATRPYATSCLGIFTCESLVDVQLFLDSEVPNSVFMPNLKVLHMNLTLIGDSVQRLIQGCPVLGQLTLNFQVKLLMDEDINDNEDKVVDFSGPSFKTLRIRRCGGDCRIVVESNVLESLEYFVHHYEGQHKVIFNTPNLKEFCYYAPADGVSFNQNLDSLVEARIGVGWLDDQLANHDALDHLCRVQRVKSLTLGEHILEALYDSQDLIPTFQNLTSLELQPGSYIGEVNHNLSWKMLPSLFEKAPHLEVLIFNRVARGNISGIEGLEYLFPEALPICFIKNLKEIEIKNFNEGEEEFEFKLIEYLLQNGKGLEKMIVGNILMPSVCKRILSFNRGSEDCEIVLDEAKKHYGEICDGL